MKEYSNEGTPFKSMESESNEGKPLLTAVFQSDKQWAVAQKKGTVYLNTLSWSRKEAIRKFMAGMDDKLKWEYFKKKYGIHCKKVTVSFQNGW